MADMSHTPGPWGWKKRNGALYIMSPNVRHVNADGVTWHDVAYLSIANGCDENDAALIASAPDLLVVAKAGLVGLETTLDLILESHCLLNDDQTPRRDTLDDEARDEVAELEADIAKARAVIARAENV